jgi:hypothetical protein
MMKISKTTVVSSLFHRRAHTIQSNIYLLFGLAIHNIDSGYFIKLIFHEFIDDFFVKRTHGGTHKSVLIPLKDLNF